MKKILITAGRTTEKIDAVRGITNFATGRLGAILARKIHHRSEVETIFFVTSEVYLIKQLADLPKVKTYLIKTSQDLKETCERILKMDAIDLIIPTMAVSDFFVREIVSTNSFLSWITQEQHRFTNDYLSNQNLLNEWLNQLKDNQYQTQKISSDQEPILFLTKAPKLITLFHEWSPKSYFVGFKLIADGTGDEIDRQWAAEVMVKNHYDLLVVNDWYKIKESQHQALILDNDENVYQVQTKEELAEKVISLIDQQNKGSKKVLCNHQKN
ncbi:phosphopantothenate-cysteine ligase [Entomoplasma freundtii]|uniref:Phosphopantothenate--cysteine ligase n=1 Tax=Entomoplasma freundtii TaxID=74700 RepID=A0A2K8NVE2_9MOLU|nr:phosphopantothenoylcysteine decarboxylase [Entomoplasma freundtii]ATZ16603.1 phosphopantothenate--cysteine ligase [Entomoplasma freundtii]TDY58231.1 phosphopantothenate-cysteine ligase [Entomoplasma freundtii]